MNSRVRIIAPLLACALAAAGCKQEMEQPQPVRPVLSTVVEPTPARQLCVRRHSRTSVQD